MSKQVLQDLQAALEALREERAQIDAQIAQLEAMWARLSDSGAPAPEDEAKSRSKGKSRRPRRAAAK